MIPQHNPTYRTPPGSIRPAGFYYGRNRSNGGQLCNLVVRFANAATNGWFMQRRPAGSEWQKSGAT